MSFVNHEFNHIFIHVPKTAGSSMECLPMVGGNGHQTASELLQKKPADYFSWGFVRNPYDRILSAYHSLKANPHHSTPDVDDLSFDEWIASGADSKATMFWTYSHTQPMAYYLCDQHNEVLVDYVGNFERLTVCWLSVCVRLKFKPQPLPKINEGNKRPHWSTYYSNPTTKKLVQEIYAVDFDVFKYSSAVNS